MKFSEDLSIRIGLVTGVAVAGVAWLLNSALFGVVTRVLLGTVLSLLIQLGPRSESGGEILGSRTSTRSMAPLYKELDLIVSKVQSFNAQSGYSSFDKTQWETISRTYLYHLISPPLNTQLERLHALFLVSRCCKGDTRMSPLVLVRRKVFPSSMPSPSG